MARKKKQPPIAITVCGLKKNVKPETLRALGKMFQAVYRAMCISTGAHLSCRKGREKKAVVG